MKSIQTRLQLTTAKWVAAVVALVMLSAPCLSAQCKDSDFAGSGVAAAPSRPNESAAPDPIQVGVVEVETGLTRTWLGNDSHQNVFSNLIKIGAWCNVEVRWSANSYMMQNLGTQNSRGVGDNFFTSQYRFVRESKQLPSLAIGYTVKFPSASLADNLGSGQTDHLLTFMAGKTIHKFSIISNFSRFWIGEPGGTYDGKYEATLAVTRPLHGKFGVIGEVYGDSRLNAANDPFANSTWALTYTVNPRLVFDSGAYVGLTSGAGAPGKSFFFGATYALGDIYHIHRN